MTYVWPSGMKGTKTYLDEQDARDDAARQALRCGPDGLPCTSITVQHRDQPAPALVLHPTTPRDIT